MTLELAQGLRVATVKKRAHLFGLVINAKAASCVVNAFVEATPISGPACVSIVRPESRTIELSGLLQIVSVAT